jgi:enoyl-CoA hydratase/carnithine racemase
VTGKAWEDCCVGDLVSYERNGAAAVLTIERPECRNAIDLATARALREGFDAFEADDEARALVLTGAGGDAFCAGFDLKSDGLDVDDPGGPLGFTRLTPAKPTIAAVDGWAVAGGLELALWCDLRLATPTSTFGCLERRWGVPLIDGGTQRLPRVVGLGRALDLILTGRPVRAEEALRIGLADRVVPRGAAREAAEELARELAHFPQQTMRADRLSVYGGLGLPPGEALAQEFTRGSQVLDEARRGAGRFARGEGRQGAF